MSLRVKVELVLFLVIGLVVALSFGIQRFAILPRLNPLEERLAQRDIERCIEALEGRQAALDALAARWADSPAVAAFATGKTNVLSQDTFGKEALRARGVSFVSILDPDGAVLWQHAMDCETGAPLEIREFPETQWPPSHPLLRTDTSHAGAYLTSAGPMLTAIRPIFDDSGDRLLARIAIGRGIDRLMLADISRRASVAFQLWRADDQRMPEEQQAALREIVERDLTVKINVREDLFRVYAAYPGLEGKPALLLRSDIHRNVLAKAYEALQQGLLAQVAIGLGSLVVLIILFRRTVMNPLRRLSDHTKGIRETNDLTGRLGMKRGDEIGQLAGEFDRMVAQLQDEMVKQKEAEEALRESEERYALAVRGANDGLWDWNLVTKEIHYSERWKKMLGYEDHEIGNTPEVWFNLVHPDDRENLQASLDAHLADKTAHFEMEFRMRHKGNNYLWVLCRGLAIRDAKGQATRMAGSLADITLRKLVEEQLSHQALHDALTTLPNRALLLDRLNQALKHAKREKDYLFAILFLDVDRFKVVNDGLGHLVGDILLTSIAERLSESVRDVDTVSRGGETVARFGGDEFVILLENLHEVSDASLVAQRILETLSQPFDIEGNQIYVTASIGIAVSGPEYESPEELVRNADTAMYRAKAGGKARFEIFDSDMHSKAMARLQLENDMRRAVEREEFVVHYQPIVHLKTGRVDAFEALIRWNHPERGLVSPAEFIPVAEETGMIVPIGEFVMRQACRQTRAWQIKHPDVSNLRISVNLSVHEFSKPNLVETMERILFESGLDPRFLKLEITESAIMESIDFVTRTLKMLRERQIELSIDDFGTGYSSLCYLHRFPMDTLKIDQAFVREMHTTDENFHIVRTIVTLAQALNMSVVAEGIETEQQAEDLTRLGCEFGQGFLFSRPVSANQAETLILGKRESEADLAPPVS